MVSAGIEVVEIRLLLKAKFEDDLLLTTLSSKDILHLLEFHTCSLQYCLEKNAAMFVKILKLGISKMQGNVYTTAKTCSQ